MKKRLLQSRELLRKTNAVQTGTHTISIARESNLWICSLSRFIHLSRSLHLLGFHSWPLATFSWIYLLPTKILGCGFTCLCNCFGIAWLLHIYSIRLYQHPESGFFEYCYRWICPVSGWQATATRCYPTTLWYSCVTGYTTALPK